tara:strand:- start:53254 stop:54030 length:777 start_codon:yes stop_codon:yes gene_type:complete
MIWDKKTARTLALAAAMTMAGAALAPQAAQAESIVVRASGPSAKDFSPGKKLADNISITLKAGDIVTLLDGRGTRTLRGPGTFGSTATLAGTDTRNRLDDLFKTRTERRARTGAVRGTIPEPTSAPRSPNIWYVDISQASTACVPDPDNVKIWRPSTAEAADVTITPSAGGASGKVHFDAGQSVAWWPEELPIDEGAHYALSWAGLTKPVQIGFSLMAPGSEGLENMAAALISRKCDAQLDLLVETVALPDPAPDVGG